MDWKLQRRQKRDGKGATASPSGESQGLGGSRPVGLKSSRPATMDPVQELLCQALETEIGGVQIYEAALRCALNTDLTTEWKKYLEQTRHHEEILRSVFDIWDLDTDTETPGRLVVRHNGEALVGAMNKALETMPRNGAQLVAAECVVLAETKDHMNWELIGEVCGSIAGKRGKALKDAHEEVEEEEDEHLYHTTGWTRELWLAFLGRPAVLPPPEEVKDVKSAIGAARAKKGRTRMAPRTRA